MGNLSCSCTYANTWLIFIGFTDVEYALLFAIRYNFIETSSLKDAKHSVLKAKQKRIYSLFINKAVIN